MLKKGSLIVTIHPIFSKILPKINVSGRVGRRSDGSFGARTEKEKVAMDKVLNQTANPGIREAKVNICRDVFSRRVHTCSVTDWRAVLRDIFASSALSAAKPTASRSILASGASASLATLAHVVKYRTASFQTSETRTQK